MENEEWQQMFNKKSFRIFLFLYLLFSFVVIFVGFTHSAIIQPQLIKHSYESSYIEAIDKSYWIVSLMKVTLFNSGIATIILVALGAIGLETDNVVLLKLFAYITSIILFFKLGYGLYIFGKVVHIRNHEEIQKDHLAMFSSINNNNETLYVQMIIEETYSCCGVNSYKDYSIILDSQYGCMDWNGEPRQQFKSQGCTQKLVEAFSDSWRTLTFAVLQILTMELIAFIFANFVIKNIIKELKRISTENIYQNNITKALQQDHMTKINIFNEHKITST